jgi:hypothetical protein
LRCKAAISSRSVRAKLGVGSVTSFSYAYLAASTLVARRRSRSGSSRAPLTRRGVDPEEAGRHVVHAGWISLSIIGAAAGVFALVGGQIVQFVLGDSYGGKVGRDLGHLVVYLSPWMVAWVGFAVTFPLIFVAGRRRVLVPLALSASPSASRSVSAFGAHGASRHRGRGRACDARHRARPEWGLSQRTLRSPRLASPGRADRRRGVGSAFGGLSFCWRRRAAAGVAVYALGIYSIRSYGSPSLAYVRGLQ